MIRIIGILALSLGLLLIAAISAAAHVKAPGSDSENSGQLAIRDFTQFDNELSWAIGQWNSLSPVHVFQWYTGAYIDLVMDDYCDCNSMYNAYYQPSTDYIWMNACYLPNHTQNERRKTATHEVGHALGLAHSFPGQVMYASQSSTIYPQPHDTCSYDVYWNGISPAECGDPY